LNKAVLHGSLEKREKRVEAALVRCHTLIWILWSSPNPTLFRIALQNDYRGTFAFIDYKQYGIMTSVGAGVTGQKHRGYALSDDCITIFVNYQQVAQFKTKVDATRELKRILVKLPPEVLRSIEDLTYYLFDAV